MLNPIEHNRRAWDQRVREGRRFTRPVADDELADPMKQIDGRGWLGPSLAGKHVLCLGAGGGRQSVLYALAGGIVTVVDISQNMLELDRQVAAERKLNIRPIHASMDDLSVLNHASFDIVVQPVSTCYVPDIARVYREVARLTKIGGIYISQHKQPVSMQADVRRSSRGYELTEPYFRTGPLPQVNNSPHREPGTLEYLHRWDQLIGAMCRSGFVIEDLTEPYHGDPAAKLGSWGDRSLFVPPYVRIKARRVHAQPPAPTPGPLISP